MSLNRKALCTEIDRRYIYTLMPKFTADLLPGVLVSQSLAGIELSFIRPSRRRRLPSRQHLIPHLRVPMPQPVHVAQPGRLALPVVDIPLLDVSLVRRN